MPTDKRDLSRSNEDGDSRKQKPIEPIDRPAIHGFSRRSFLARIGATGIAASAAPLLHAVPVDDVQTPAAPTTANTQAVSMVLKINGKEHQLRLEPRVTLLD